MQFQDGLKLLSVGALQDFSIEIRADPSPVFFYPVVTSYPILSFFILFSCTHKSMRPSAAKQNVPNDVTRDASAAPARSMLPCLRAKRVAGRSELETENLCNALSEPKFFPDLRVAPRVSSSARVQLLAGPPPCVDVALCSTDRGGGVKGALTSEPSRNTNM